jgi:hypothetical protein
MPREAPSNFALIIPTVATIFIRPHEGGLPKILYYLTDATNLLWCKTSLLKLLIIYAKRCHQFIVPPTATLSWDHQNLKYTTTITSWLCLNTLRPVTHLWISPTQSHELKLQDNNPTNTQQVKTETSIIRTTITCTQPFNTQQYSIALITITS